MDEIIRQYAEKIVKNLEGNLEALILAGSFSRGEGKFYQHNGKLELMSDIEFLTVVKNRRKIIGKVIGEEKVTVGFTTKKHLLRLKPYIFTIETKKFGKVLWGNKGILDLIPDYAFADIEPIDGFILLNNRIVEQLILFNKIKNNESVHQYDFDKGYIQLVNSYLAFNKKYRGLYPEKKEEFLKIYRDSGSGLVDKVKKAFDSLHSVQNNVMNQELAMAKWDELRKYFREIWLYETSSINNFIKLPGIKARLKGWIKAFRTKKIVSFNPWHIFFTSPQFLIYQWAAGEYFKQNLNCKKADKIIDFWTTLVK